MMTLTQSLISAKGIDKTYGATSPVQVLRGLDLTVMPGDRIAITGPSGAGKSTLLHLLGTLEHPTRGEILFEGENVFQYTESRLSAYRNRKIGFVFQFHYLMLEFTALENVMIPMLIGGEGTKRARERAESLLASVLLRDRLHHLPSQLSGGEQQRVAIARALAQNPVLLLTDEMTGNLDSQTGASCLKLLDELHQKSNMAVISVTHDREVARRFPVVYQLEDGNLTARTRLPDLS